MVGELWYSDIPVDEVWDAFLLESPHGHYEQTSLWARVKQRDDWQPLRVVLLGQGRIMGGFQILKKRLGIFGSIGYVSKGPVCLANCRAMAQALTLALKEVSHRQRIRAIIVQPPDNDEEFGRELLKPSFQANHIIKVIETTIKVDVTQSEDILWSNLKRQKRQNIKRARKRLTRVREGTKEDLPLFFKSMVMTCRRQGTEPSPSREEIFHDIWDYFNANGQAKLFIAELNGEYVSGIFAIPFGQEVCLWKFGWTGEYGDCRPNELLFWESFQWAKTNGYLRVNLIGADTNIIEASRNSSSKALKTSTTFKLGLGGEIIELPKTRIYISNFILRMLYVLFIQIIKRAFNN